MGDTPIFNITILDIFFYAYIALVLYGLIIVLSSARSIKDVIVSLLCTPIYAIIMIVWYLISIVYIALLIIKYIILVIVGIISLILTLTIAVICDVGKGLIDIPAEGGETCKDFVDGILDRTTFNE